MIAPQPKPVVVACGVVPMDAGRALSVDEVAVILGTPEKPLDRSRVYALCRVGAKRRGSDAVVRLEYTSLPKGRVFLPEHVADFLDTLTAVDKSTTTAGRIEQRERTKARRHARESGARDDGMRVTLVDRYPSQDTLSRGTIAKPPRTPRSRAG